MLKSLRRFCAGDCGAVTVDWVVLTAAIVGLGFAVLGPIGFQTDSLAIKIGGFVSGVPVGSDPAAGGASNN